MAKIYQQAPSLNGIDATDDSLNPLLIQAEFDSDVDHLSTINSIGGVFSLGCSLLDIATGITYYNIGSIQSPDFETNIGSGRIDIALSSSDLTSEIVATDIAAYTRALQAFTITGVRASLKSHTGDQQEVHVDIKLNGTSIFNQEVDPSYLLLGLNETTTVGGLQPSIATPDVANDDIITIDILSPENGSGATGLIVYITGEPI